MPLRFENCTLDPATREFRRGAELVPLEPQVFDLLVYVIRNRDRVVSKDDLIEAVWGGRIVSESSLTTRINAARKALGDSGEEQRLIRTIARKGIRFVGSVQETDGTEGIAAAAPSQPTDAAPDTPGLPLPDKPSIAVLPFANMSGDPEQEYFADGLAEDLITALSKFHWLFVIARNSSFVFKGKPVDVKRVGQELGVRYVVEGSVRRAGGRVRVTAQLVEASTSSHIWAERYDRSLDDIFAVQDELTAHVAQAIKAELIDAESHRRSAGSARSVEALDLTFRARSLMNRITRERCAEARSLLEQAAATKAPNVEIYAELARAYLNDAAHHWVSDINGAITKAEECLRDALALDSKDAQTYVSLGVVHRMRGELVQATAALERAVQLDPNHANAHSHFAGVLLQMHRVDEAIDYAHRAHRLSPMHANTMRILTTAYFHAGRVPEAIGWGVKYRKAHHGGVVDPVLIAAYALAGQLDEAGALLAELRRSDANASSITNYRAVGLWPGTPQYEAQRDRMYEGLRLAGMPE